KSIPMSSEKRPNSQSSGLITRISVLACQVGLRPWALPHAAFRWSSLPRARTRSCGDQDTVMCALRRQQIIHEYTIPNHRTKKNANRPSVYHDSGILNPDTANCGPAHQRGPANFGFADFGSANSHYANIDYGSHSSSTAF